MKRISAILAAFILAATSSMVAFASDTSSNEITVNTDGLSSDISQQTVESNISSFKEQMNTFLESSGFDYDSFNSQKFSLPDSSDTLSSADLINSYEGLISSFEEFGVGTTYAISNTGYTQNVISSFSDQFGSGLASGYSTYELTYDPTSVFESANSTRSSLFSSAMSSDAYQSVASYLNVSDIFSSVENMSIDSSSISSSLNANLEDIVNDASGMNYSVDFFDSISDIVARTEVSDETKEAAESGNLGAAAEVSTAEAWDSVTAVSVKAANEIAEKTGYSGSTNLLTYNQDYSESAFSTAVKNAQEEYNSTKDDLEQEQIEKEAEISYEYEDETNDPSLWGEILHTLSDPIGSWAAIL